MNLKHFIGRDLSDLEAYLMPYGYKKEEYANDCRIDFFNENTKAEIQVWTDGKNVTYFRTRSRYPLLHPLILPFCNVS
jgi:hypothetical protein